MFGLDSQRRRRCNKLPFFFPAQYRSFIFSFEQRAGGEVTLALSCAAREKKSIHQKLFSFPVEKDKDFSHQRRHYKEFRFDLTQIPEGEAVTAAEFRIYKERSHSRYDNITLKVSIYQVIKENQNK